MASGGPIKKFRAGEAIFSQGDKADCAYIIEEGEVQVFLDDGKGKEKLLSKLDKGELFGEMGVIDHTHRSASARAITDCELFMVSRKQLTERIDTSDPIVRLVINNMLTHLRRTLDTTAGGKVIRFPIERRVNSTQPLKDISELRTSDKHVIEKIRFEQELVNALSDEEFTLYFQPIVDLPTGNLKGFESLIRWQSPKRGLVRPDVFLGIAEETSLIIPLGHWIIREACQTFRYILDFCSQLGNDVPDLFISCNVSPKQIDDPNFFDILNDAISANNLRPERIKLELTESLFAKTKEAQNWFENCKNAGVKIALDDFGTGYSSLSYLADSPVDNLKIDKSFTFNLGNPNTQTIVKSIIAMAKGLNLPVIAEGIEKPEHAEILKSYGCEFGQGYMYSKPLPLYQLLEKWILKAAVSKDTTRIAA